MSSAGGTSLAERLYQARHPVTALFVALTAYFALQLQHLEIATHFRDLYPGDSEAVRLLDQYPGFGSPLTVSLLIQIKDGTIYDPETLATIQEATRRIDLVPGVDHNQILSIASRSVKHVEPTVGGIESSNLLVGKVPQSDAEIAAFRERLRTTPGVIGTLVSVNEDAALIHATLIERLTDYAAVHAAVHEIVRDLSDEHHQLYALGQPILTGWIYAFRSQTYLMFGIGLASMVLLLVLYFRNLAGVVVPTLVGCVSAIWGFGLASVLGFNLDPLIIVVPILLIARALSHSVQMCERFFELYHEHRDHRRASIESLQSLFAPGAGGIVCDAAGIFLIGLAPMPVIWKLAIVGGFWSLSLIFTAIVLSFLLLSYLPTPRNVDDLVIASSGSQGPLDRIFAFIAYFSATQRRAAVTVFAFLILTAGAGWLAEARAIGDIHPGTSLLWPDAPFNRAALLVNRGFSGSDALQIAVEGHGPDAIKSSKALDLMLDLQRFMERDPNVGATVSFADIVSQGARMFHGGHPKWMGIPEDDADAAMISNLVMSGAGAGDYDRFVTQDFRAASVGVWYKDQSAETIAGAIARAEAYRETPLAKAAGDLHIRVGSGELGLRGANNALVNHLELGTVLLITLLIFAVTSLMYQSVTAGLLLVLVANMAYLLTSAFMWWQGIALDVNTFPVAAVGIGVGIDYNIYLMSRMREEFRIRPDYAVVVPSSIFTTGKAIFSTATTMIVGIVIWYFLSNLRFQAEMGLLLTIVMLAHVILALFFQAAAMQLLRPAFIKQGLSIESLPEEETRWASVR